MATQTIAPARPTRKERRAQMDAAFAEMINAERKIYDADPTGGDPSPY